VPGTRPNQSSESRWPARLWRRARSNSTGDHLQQNSLTDDEVRGLLTSIIQSYDYAIIGRWIDGTVFCWNEGAERLYGFTADEMLGADTSSIVPPDRRDELKALMDRVFRGERIEDFETVRIRKDGQPVYVSLTALPIHDRSGRIIGASVISRNITNRKQDEAQLRTSEERFRLLADSAPVMIWMADIDKRRTYFNRPWLDFTGRATEDELGDGWAQSIPPDDRERVLTLFRDAFNARKQFEVEYSLRRRDGAYRLVHESGVPFYAGDGAFAGYVGSRSDITDQRRAEGTLHAAVKERTAELAAANERLQLEVDQRKRAEAILAGEKRILELIAAGATVDEALLAVCTALESHCAGARCRIHVPNDGGSAGNETREFGSQGLFGLPAEFLASPSERSTTRIADAVSALKTWARPRNVMTLWVEPIIGITGQSLGSVSVAFCDDRSPTKDEFEAGAAAARLAGIIIEKARGDDRGRKQLSELAHVARLATMGEMASGLAHELNQPLCAIVNFIGACLELMDSNPGGPDLRQAMNEVAKQAERAGEVIRRLREFVKRSEPQRAALDINEVTREVIGLTRTEIRHHEVNVKLQLGQRLPRVLADPIQVQQVLVNLVRNAIDAMDDTPSDQRHLRIRTGHRGDFIVVSVRDSGRGITEEARAQVFESFFTTKKQGMGMGLSISRSIVEMHDGRIWVTPNSTSGVTFHFTLPLARRRRNVRSKRDRIRRR